MNPTDTDIILQVENNKEIKVLEKMAQMSLFLNNNLGVFTSENSMFKTEFNEERMKEYEAILANLYGLARSEVNHRVSSIVEEAREEYIKGQQVT